MICLNTCDTIEFATVASVTDDYYVSYRINGYERKIAVPATIGDPIEVQASALGIVGVVELHLLDVDGITELEKNIFQIYLQS